MVGDATAGVAEHPRPADAALDIALDPDTQPAEQTREAITRLFGPSDDQGGPREEDR
jgi:hypothetical protein